MRKSFIIAALACFLGLRLLAADTTPLVEHGDTWHYRKGNSGTLQTDWKTAADATLDITWLSGKGGFGYADNDPEVSLCQTLLNDMRGNYSTLAFRRTFSIATPVDPELHLFLTMDWDDGFIAWLDGTHLASENSPNAPAEPRTDASATASRESSRGDKSPELPHTYDLGRVGTRLAPGPHVLALVGLNSSLSGSGDFVQVADLFIAPAAQAPTNCFRGPLAGEITWKASEGPVVICGDVTVIAGATLRIDPGATVQFDAGANLIIASGGRLLAEGSETNRIRFTRSPSNLTAWGGIRISGDAVSPECRITFADIEGNSATAIHSSGGTVFLDHITFRSADRQYISLDDSSFVVSHCQMPPGTTSFEPVHGTGGIKPGGHGIFLRNFIGGSIGYSDLVDFTGGQRPGPIVHFIDNVLVGSQDDGLDLDGTDAWVEGNIFLRIHRNGNTPDSSAAVSGGNNSGNVSRVTILGNLFYDCDNAITAKQGNFYTLFANTIVHTTNAGGIDFDSGVINVRDTTPSITTFSEGCYLEGNVISDAVQLVRNYDPLQTAVTLNNNILPLPWLGPGTGNTVTVPTFAHLPQPGELTFTNWTGAQVLKGWFARSGTPGTAQDAGSVGLVISGEPPEQTDAAQAELSLGVNRRGFGIPPSAWPEGSGYTHYKWRLDGAGPWSAETPIATPIRLTHLTPGLHFVEATGRRDSGLYQDDPLFGEAAHPSRSRAWTVTDVLRIERVSLAAAGVVEVQFTAKAGTSYTVQTRNDVASGDWRSVQTIPASPQTKPMTVSLTGFDGGAAHFFRIATP